MRRVIAVLICIFLFALPAHAANSATRVSTSAVVNANATCNVTIDAEIRLDEPARGLKFPLGTDIKSVTLNGSSAPLTQSEGITSINLSHLDGKIGMYSCSISYEVNSVVTLEMEQEYMPIFPSRWLRFMDVMPSAWVRGAELPFRVTDLMSVPRGNFSPRAGSSRRISASMVTLQVPLALTTAVVLTRVAELAA